MRKKDPEIQKLLLDAARQTACAEGVDAINIRRLASEANIAIGTVYNYFENKQEVLLALTEEYWRGVLDEMRRSVVTERFSDQVAEMIVFLRSRMNDCAEILMKSLSGDAAAGRARMASMQEALRVAMMDRLDRDTAIHPDVWNETCTKKAFTRFVLSNIIALLQQKEGDETVFLYVINRILY
ncbi:MAG: TetR/AcrR family transcriptional regulator [Christensenella sp.]|nr:TetR/AcrR family transcriptional regulator [Christensenella sp.]